MEARLATRAAAVTATPNPDIERELELMKTHYVFAALKDLPVDARYCGFHAVERCEIKAIYPHYYHTRDKIMADQTAMRWQRVARKPGHIVSTLVQEAGGPAHSGGEGFGELLTLRGYPVETRDAVQVLTLPVIPASILDVKAILENIQRAPIGAIVDSAIRLIDRVTDENSAEREEAYEAVETARLLIESTPVVLFGDKSARRPGAIAEMLKIVETGMRAADLHLTRTIREMEDRLKPGGVGKGIADEYDIYLCQQLRRPVPRIARNVFDGTPDPSATPVVAMRECPACGWDIPAKVKFCRECKTWLPGHGPGQTASATDVGEEPAARVVFDPLPGDGHKVEREE